MNKAQFKVGSVYLDASGRVTKVVGPFNGEWRDDGAAWVQMFNGTGWCADGYRDLSSGADASTFGFSCGVVRTLIPGELVLRDGQWVAVEEAKPADDFHDAASYVFQGLEQLIYRKAADSNAAMIARDGPAKPRVCVVAGGWCDDRTQCETRCLNLDRALGIPRSTAKPALAALTLSPDLSEAKHQVNAQHAMAAVRNLRKSVGD